MKGYRLWCLDPKSPKLIIEKNVIFNEFAMLTSMEDSAGSSSDTVTDVGADEQVEFELNSHDSVQLHADQFSGSEEEDEEIAAETEDCIARRRERRVIKPPSRYVEFAFAHAISIAKETWMQESREVFQNLFHHKSLPNG